jgi:hypothetical protein
VVVGGGYNDDDGFLDSTEIIDPASRQIRPGGPMGTPRLHFGMYKIGYAGSRILLTFGAVGSSSYATAAAEKASLLQEWDPAAEVWKPAPAVLARRTDFAAVTVEARHVCRQGELAPRYHNDSPACSGEIRGSLTGFCEDFHFNSTSSQFLEYCKPGDAT